MTTRHFNRLSEIDEARVWNWLDNPYGTALVINGPAASGKTFLARLLSEIVFKLYGRRPAVYDNCELSVMRCDLLSGNINIIIQLDGLPAIGPNIPYIDIKVSNQNL